jgi:DNA-binding response OmpR family regulator
MRALIVEDEKNLAKELKKILENEKFSVSLEFNGEKAIDKILGEQFDIIILDIMLPDMDGFEILKFIREEEIKTPVLFLTAKSALEDRVKGLDLGADDYIIKPFSSSELIARVRAIIRRVSGERSNIINIGKLKLNIKTKEIFFNYRPVNLTPKEYSILEFLILNKEKPVSKYDIAEHIWGDSYDILSTSNFVEVHIKNIRKKFLKYSKKQVIETVRGFGYKII